MKGFADMRSYLEGFAVGWLGLGLGGGLCSGFSFWKKTPRPGIEPGSPA